MEEIKNECKITKENEKKSFFEKHRNKIIGVILLTIGGVTGLKEYDNYQIEKMSNSATGMMLIQEFKSKVRIHTKLWILSNSPSETLKENIESERDETVKNFKLNNDWKKILTNEVSEKASKEALDEIKEMLN